MIIGISNDILYYKFVDSTKHYTTKQIGMAPYKAYCKEDGVNVMMCKIRANNLLVIIITRSFVSNVKTFVFVYKRNFYIGVI